LFREFAITLSVAIVVSLCVSLTTRPHDGALISEIEKGRSEENFYLAASGCFNGAWRDTAQGIRWVYAPRQTEHECLA